MYNVYVYALILIFCYCDAVDLAIIVQFSILIGLYKLRRIVCQKNYSYIYNWPVCNSLLFCIEIDLYIVVRV